MLIFCFLIIKTSLSSFFLGGGGSLHTTRLCSLKRSSAFTAGLTQIYIWTEWMIGGELCLNTLPCGAGYALKRRTPPLPPLLPHGSSPCLCIKTNKTLENIIRADDDGIKSVSCITNIFLLAECSIILFPDPPYVGMFRRCVVMFADLILWVILKA